jgi:hypothetical protein
MINEASIGGTVVQGAGVKLRAGRARYHVSLIKI